MHVCFTHSALPATLARPCTNVGKCNTQAVPGCVPAVPVPGCVPAVPDGDPAVPDGVPAVPDCVPAVPDGVPAVCTLHPNGRPCTNSV